MIDQLIKKYFSGECTEAEKEKLLQHFREHPSEVGALFAEEEWNKVADAPVQKTLATETFLDGLTSDDTIAQERKLHWGKWIAAAAVLGFIACISLYLFKGGKQSQVAQQLADTAAVPAAALPSYTAYKNDHSNSLTYKLPDGSIVTLSPHSEIKYAAAFEPGKRDIYLEGEAVFEVAKDAKRPFTVYCREVATTALGTKFKVSALRDNVHVSVLLLEGKIVVKSTAVAYTGDKYYLLPGNEIQYDRNNNRFTLNKEEEPAQSSQQLVVAHPSEDVTAADEHIQVNTEKKVVRFNDVGMAKVLDILAYKYNVKIAYPPDLINKIRFVGTIRQNDPIEKILSDITQMNNLQLIHDTAQRQYIIR